MEIRKTKKSEGLPAFAALLFLALSFAGCKANVEVFPPSYNVTYKIEHHKQNISDDN